METGVFLKQLLDNDIGFFTGVPDSLLKPLCDQLVDTYGINLGRHIIAHNEGGCVALASGYHLATGRVPCVFMQNSGIGNIANPAISLTHPKVYAIPVLYVVGWRGEPGMPYDEPQHIYQGEVTLCLLNDIGLEVFVLDGNTTENELSGALRHFGTLFAEGKSAAIVVRKNAFSGHMLLKYKNDYVLNREQTIEKITQVTGEDIIVSTTGKISRELFEVRESQNMSHCYDFLTVGSMGHSLMIALGIAMNKKDRRVWCLDGDGALLMHMGSLGVVGNQKPENLIHVVLNNEAHETVGGMPTVIGTVNLPSLAQAFGYRNAYQVKTEADLDDVLSKARTECGPIFIEIKVALASRPDLGRPTIAAVENKLAFMENLRGG